MRTIAIANQKGGVGKTTTGELNGEDVANRWVVTTPALTEFFEAEEK